MEVASSYISKKKGREKEKKKRVGDQTRAGYLWRPILLLFLQLFFFSRFEEKITAIFENISLVVK